MSPVVQMAWYQRIADRLEAHEATVELYHLHRLSACEVELLVRLERGWGPAQ